MLYELLKYVPLRKATDLQLWIRNNFAKREWPENSPHVEIPVTVDVEAVLQDAHFEDASGLSLLYENEVLNLRRPAGLDADGIPIETHIRLRYNPADPTRFEANVHGEPNRLTAKHHHVHNDGHLDWLSPQQIGGILSEAGVPESSIHTG